MRPLFGIAIKSGHRVNSSQCGRLNYQTSIPAKGRGNSTVPFKASSLTRLNRATIEPSYVECNFNRAV